MKSPCKDCLKRHPHCHSECKDYIEFDEENKARRKVLYFNTILENHSPSQDARIKKDMLERSRGNK